MLRAGRADGVAQEDGRKQGCESTLENQISDRPLAVLGELA